MIGYYGFEMNGSKHSIEVYIDGRPLLFADGSHYVEVFAERRDQSPGVHQRQSSDAIAATLDKHRFTVSPHIHRSTIKWPCQHTMTINPPSPCPYCEIEKLQAQVRELGGGSKSADYQKGYVAGRARYVYLKNKLARIEEALRQIGYGGDHPSLSIQTARIALEREKKNRRGGLCDDIGPAETATT